MHYHAHTARVLGKVLPAFEYRNRVVVDTQAQHRSCVSYEDYLKQLEVVFGMATNNKNIVTYKSVPDTTDKRHHYVDFGTVATAVRSTTTFFKKLREAWTSQKKVRFHTLHDCLSLFVVP